MFSYKSVNGTNNDRPKYSKKNWNFQKTIFFYPKMNFFHNTRKILCLIHSVTAKSCKLNLLSSKRHRDMASAQSDQCSLVAQVIEGFFVRWLELTLALLNPDISCFCKQCRSRSVGFWRSQLMWICTICHLLYEYISTISIKESEWLTIRSGRGIFIQHDKGYITVMKQGYGLVGFVANFQTLQKTNGWTKTYM